MYGGNHVLKRAISRKCSLLHIDSTGAKWIALIYNVAAGKTSTIGELIDIAREKLPGLAIEVGELDELDIDYNPSHTRGRSGAYDISKIQHDTGWKPRPLREAFHSYK